MNHFLRRELVIIRSIALRYFCNGNVILVIFAFSFMSICSSQTSRSLPSPFLTFSLNYGYRPARSMVTVTPYNIYFRWNTHFIHGSSTSNYNDTTGKDCGPSRNINAYLVNFRIPSSEMNKATEATNCFKKCVNQYHSDTSRLFNKHLLN